MPVFSQTSTLLALFLTGVQDNLRDFHDPAGVHWHRATKATAAGLLAAIFLSFGTSVALPLLPISALIFAHTNHGSQVHQQKSSAFRSLAIALAGIILLAIFYNLPIARAIAIIFLSFLSQYATKFGSEYGFVLIWILILVASDSHPAIAALFPILLNIIVGFLLAYFCFFELFPYDSQRVLMSLAKRTKYRLGTLIREIAKGAETSNLKRRIFSLLETQRSLLTQQKKAIADIGLGDLAQQEAVFQAMLVLEQSLYFCPRAFILQVFSQQVSTFLNQDQSAIALPPDIEQPEVNLALISLVSALTSSDYPLIASAIPKPKPPPFIKFDLTNPIDRRAYRSAIAVMIALGIGQALSLAHGEWVVTSALIVCQDGVGNTIWKSRGRLLGTFWGAIAALALYGLIFQHHTLIFGFAFLAILPYLYLRPSLENYGYAKFFQQIAFVCFLASIGQVPSLEIMEWRAGNVAIGCAVGLIASFGILPNWTREKWKGGLITALESLQSFFEAIAPIYRNGSCDRQHLWELSQKAMINVYKLPQSLESRQHELMLTGEKISYRLALIQAHVTLYEAILYWSFIAEHSEKIEGAIFCTSATEQLTASISEAFTQLQGAIGSRSLLLTPLIRLPEAGTLPPLERVAAAIEYYAAIKNAYAEPISQSPDLSYGDG